jgi:predicted AAA+ superfamily ATPase
LRREKKIAYYKFPNSQEIDFVVHEGRNIKELVQVCYDISNFQTKEREVIPLIKGIKELKCTNLTVITWDFEAREEKTWFGKKGKIKFVPLWKWLLERE